MKIKLAIIEGNVNYLNRIVSVFSTKYPDKFEMYSFTSVDLAIPVLSASKIDVVIVSESIDFDLSMIPKRCGFAYFVDAGDIESFRNQPAICRFQRADLIYKQILSIYSEYAGKYAELKPSDDNCKVVAFTAPSGGVGASTLAAAYAIHNAAKGLRTLYLNLERFGSSDDFFSAEGLFCMSDVIYSLKTKKVNLAMKLESCIKHDSRGVCFISQPKLALDMMELNVEEILRLISELRLTGSYDRIVLDTEFGLDADRLVILHQANLIVLVGDGSTISNTKLSRAITALSLKEQTEDTPLLERSLLAYNKYSSKTSVPLKNIDIQVIGGARKFEHATVQQILEQLCKMTMFDEIDKY